MSAFYRVSFTSANNEDLRQAFALASEAGSPVDLTGASLRMGLADLSGAARLEASTGNGRVTITNAANGSFELLIPASLMGTLPEGIYRHDMVLAMAGRTQRIWTGTLSLAQGVTQ
mgnify:CR=1 FL=1